MLAARHAGMLEGPHDRILKAFDGEPKRSTDTLRRSFSADAIPAAGQSTPAPTEQPGVLGTTWRNAVPFRDENPDLTPISDGQTLNTNCEVPFAIGGTCVHQEKGVLPIEGIDMVFNNENALTNLQSMACVSASSNGSAQPRGRADEGWEPLTGGCSVPESERRLRDKIRRKMLRRKKRKCCGLVYAFHKLKEAISLLFTVQFWLRTAATCMACLCCDNNMRVVTQVSNSAAHNLRFPSDPQVLAAAAEAYRDCLLANNDSVAAAEAAALTLGLTCPEARRRISMFPPIGLITPVTQALRYRSPDFAYARALEARLQRHIEARIKAMYRDKAQHSSDASGGDTGAFNGSWLSQNPFGREDVSPDPSPSRPRYTVLFARDGANEIYKLLRHFEEARACMAWQQSISREERHRCRGSLFGFSDVQQHAPPQHRDMCPGAECSSAARTPTCSFFAEKESLHINSGGCSLICEDPHNLGGQLQECLRRYYSDNDAPYAVPVHFNRMDKNFVWQLLENTGVFAPAPPVASLILAQEGPLSSSLEGGAGSPRFRRPLTATVVVVVRVFAYPCGVYSGWACAARLA
ncbi:hypothetical protein BESB_010530 [Besnoitia besnoiti]|uniref:Uncharacterized protein n=1 Tax=Besnoitia besnoiti TaxID=94643 RepID=A0A2A9MPQ7_BESBE|nr:hypothetical protein BESB_010530 [Besnoitia besnoiti]PFH38711.1 hypothetical protein BESB_010530 [Besnoitia besnoiti]